MTSLSKVDRRGFMRNGAIGAGALWISSLQELSARRAHGEHSNRGSRNRGGGADAYGPPSPKTDETTGLSLLQLPDGFEDLVVQLDRRRHVRWCDVSQPARRHGRRRRVADARTTTTATRSFDGRYQSKHDRGGRSGRDHNGNDRWDDDDRAPLEPPGAGPQPRAGERCAVPEPARDHLRQRRRRRDDQPSVRCQEREVAGGLVVARGHGAQLRGRGDALGDMDLAGRDHQRRATAGASRSARRRIARSAVRRRCTTWDASRTRRRWSIRETGFVYETEDSSDCGFYRFVPYSRGKLMRGGKLYMMSVKNDPNADLGGNIPVGTTWDVRWVRIDDPAATLQSCFAQGSAKGGARFRRLEGAWWGDGVGYFVSTDGGSVARGPGLRVRSSGRDVEADLRLSGRDGSRQPGQHRPSRRAAASSSAKTPRATACSANG